MGELLKTLVNGGIIAAIVAIVTLILERRWKKQDAKSETVRKLNEIEEKLDKHIRDDEQYKAKQSRARILRYNTEIKQGLRHSAEEFDDIISAVDEYERFSNAHPDFPNFKAVSSIENIKRVYKKCVEANDFI